MCLESSEVVYITITVATTKRPGIQQAAASDSAVVDEIKGDSLVVSTIHINMSPEAPPRATGGQGIPGSNDVCFQIRKPNVLDASFALSRDGV